MEFYRHVPVAISHLFAKFDLNRSIILEGYCDFLPPGVSLDSFFWKKRVWGTSLKLKIAITFKYMLRFKLNLEKAQKSHVEIHVFFYKHNVYKHI